MDNGFNTIQFRLCSTSLCARDNQLAIDLSQLLLVHESPSSGNDIVLCSKFKHRLFRRRGFLAKRLKPLLQPIARSLVGLVSDVQLILNVGIRDRVRYVRGAVRILRRKVYFNDVAHAHSLDVKFLFKSEDRLTHKI